MRGKFITLEGGEGVGKSTQAKRLVEYLASQGIKAIATREVGGSKSAEEIRALWLSKGEGYWDPLSEVLLIMAARREHMTHTILPAIEGGTWVVSDRFIDSTRAYQGVGLGVGLDKIDAIYKEIAGDFWPDLTLLLDTPVEIGMSRMAARKGQDDRYQQQKIAFHETLRKAYHSIAAREEKRFRLIDASANMDAVAVSIAKTVSEYFGIKVSS